MSLFILWAIFLGTIVAWLMLGICFIYKYGWDAFCRDLHGIFEGDDNEDIRLSYGRVFTFIFLLPAFLIIGYTVYQFTEGAGWQIFVGSAIAVVAALLPYMITKTSEVIEIIKTIKNKNCSKGE